MTQLLNQDNIFYLNGQKLSGVSNLSLGYTNPLENYLTLGAKNFGYFLNGPIESSLEISRSLIYSDPLLAFTGDSFFSGNFSYGGKSYSFQSGYLTNYSVSCSVGEIPQVSSRISILGEFKSGENFLSEQVNDGLFIPSPRTISVSGLDFSSNRVRSFNYSLEVQKQPIFSLEGGRTAQSVNFISPINVSLSVEIEMANSAIRDSFSYCEKKADDSVIITINDRTLNNSISSFEVPNSTLLGESVQVSSDGQPVKSLTFGGFLE